jgi:actin-related protein 5
MSELLFECYQVPSVCYGVDSLFSFSFNDNPNGTSLIISIGFNSTHVIPFIDGKQVAEKTRRINVGGNHMLNYLHRLMQLKYPVHVNNITLSRIEELFHGHCSIAYDYFDALKLWSSHDYYEKYVKKVQLPYSQVSAPPTLSDAEKLAKRKEMSKRLAEINARKREERLIEENDTLKRLEELLESYDEDEEEDFEMGLKEFNLNSYEELEKMITATKQKIDKIQQKMQQSEVVEKIEEKQPPPIPQPPPNTTLDEWLKEIREKKQQLLEKKQMRKQRRSDLAKRRTAAAQERMRIISRLAGKEKGTDDFGMRDSDWEVYKAISKEQDSDESDNENEKLLEYDDILRHHDPNEDEPEMKMGIAEYHQLHFCVESIRAAEILFQPSMMGIFEAGLAETIDYVLKLFTTEEQQRLVDNIFITGGPSKISGLKERLTKELTELRPFKSTFKIKIAKDPSLDAWNGARKFASNSNNLQNYLISRADYNEFGGEYVKEFYASNRYFPTPTAIVEKFENP